ncbi:uncharacterized protein ACWYII_043220 [Salvelinus alpinus]
MSSMTGMLQLLGSEVAQSSSLGVQQVATLTVPKQHFPGHVQSGLDLPPYPHQHHHLHELPLTTPAEPSSTPAAYTFELPPVKMLAPQVQVSSHTPYFHPQHNGMGENFPNYYPRPPAAPMVISNLMARPTITPLTPLPWADSWCWGTSLRLQPSSKAPPSDCWPPHAAAGAASAPTARPPLGAPGGRGHDSQGPQQEAPQPQGGTRGPARNIKKE